MAQNDNLSFIEPSAPNREPPPPQNLCQKISSFYSRHRKILQWIPPTIAILLIIFLLMKFLPMEIYLQNLADLMLAHQSLGIPLLCFLNMFAVFTFLPVALVETFGAFVYGWTTGFLIGFFAKVIACQLAFLAARYFCATNVRAVLLEYGSKMHMLDRLVRENQWKACLLIRVWAIPIAIRNYFVSALQITAVCHLVCVIIIEIPFSIAFAFLGTSSKNLVEVTSGDGDSRTNILVFVVCVLSFFLVSGTIFLVVRRIFARLEAEEQNYPVSELGGGVGQQDATLNELTDRLTEKDALQSSFDMNSVVDVEAQNSMVACNHPAMSEV
eukprot:TRINITY_DN722_c0_g1_i1.p1 TRINITY_DN722_c0_g1~~TRINITY_DN722_c0_g1_i1.p1  ORF type:complete len:327 (+),score=44.21 TRINITY_DN722_c0_g1_i1:61-1041(+)